MNDHQCPSCGGFCKKSGCERENAALIEEPKAGLCPWEVEPYGYAITDQYGTTLDFDRDGYTDGQLIEPIYSAEALAIAVANERERAAKLLDQTDLSKLPDEWKVFFTQLLNAYAEAIREKK